VIEEQARNTPTTTTLCNACVANAATGERISETWPYDLVVDSSQQLGQATLLFTCGLHYNCHIDAINKACSLVADVLGKYGRTRAVFALKIVLFRTSATACCNITKITRWN
jgi:hypothetical protein